MRPIGRLGPARRVRKRREFQLIQSEGRRVTTRHFIFVLHVQEPDEQPRLGITASRRIGGAVQRNRAKRLIREAFRATGELWEKGVDVVVIVRHPLLGLRLPQVLDEWRAAGRAIRRRTREAIKDAKERQSDLAEGG